MQKMMKGVKSVRCLQGAGVTIGKWVVGIPHEQPIGDGASRYSAECIWRVSTYTTHAGYTHTLTGTWDTQIHIQKTVHMCRKFAMLHQDSKCTQTQCNWVKSTYIDAHTHKYTYQHTNTHTDFTNTHSSHQWQYQHINYICHRNILWEIFHWLWIHSPQGDATYVGAERMSKELLLNSYKFSCCVISYFSLWHLSWNNWQILKELHRSACWNAPWNSAGGPSDQGRTSLRSDYKVSWCFHTNTKCADICILLQCNVSLRMWSIAA